MYFHQNLEVEFFLDCNTFSFTYSVCDEKVKISENRDELLSMCPIDAATGEVASAETRIFTEEIHTQRKNLQAAKKANNLARSVAREEVENQIANDCGIWDNVETVDHLSKNRNHPSFLNRREDISSESLLPISNEASIFQFASMEKATNDTSCKNPPVDSLPVIPKPVLIPEALSMEKTAAAAPGVKADNINIRLSPEIFHQKQDTNWKIIKPDEKIFWDSMKSLVAIATPDNIEFLDSVVTSLKASLISSPTRSSLEEPKPSYQIPERYKEPGKDKVPIYTGIDFYLLSGVKNALQKKSYTIKKGTRDLEKSWKLLVRHCLIEVYSSHLGNYSAKGTKENQRPAIDSNLYKGLLYWARDWYGDEIDEDDYVELINKTAYNKRKSVRQNDQKQQVLNEKRDEANPTSPKSCEKKIQKLDKQKTGLPNQVTPSNPSMEKPQIRPAAKGSQSYDPEASQKLEIPTSENVNLNPSSTLLAEASQKIALKDARTVVQGNTSKSTESYPQNASQQQFQQSDERRAAAGSLTKLSDQPYNLKLVVQSEKAAYPLPTNSVLHSQGSVSLDFHNQYDKNPFNNAQHRPNSQYFNNLQLMNYPQSPYFQYPTYENIHYPEYYPLQNRESVENRSHEQHFRNPPTFGNSEAGQTSASPQSCCSSEMDYTSL